MADKDKPAEPAELDELTRRLYSGPSDAFVTARDEQVRLARQAGDRELARRLAALRRPTQHARVVNLLALHRSELLAQLLQVGEQLRGGQLSREDVQELSARRRALVRRLLVEANALASADGVRPSTDLTREVESTLHAAVADPQSAAAVRSGRLTRTLVYTEFGPQLVLATAPAAASPGATSTGAATPGTPGHATEAAVRSAAAAVRAAEDAARSGQKAALSTATRREELAGAATRLAAEVQRLTDRLAETQRQLAAAEHAALAAAAEREQANQRLQQARDQLEQARQQAGQ